MALTAADLEFLNALEKEEMRLLTWGLVDGFFTEGELEERATVFVSTKAERERETSFHDGWELVEALLDAHLLWRIPETDRYRTRMAETVRLFARLRQMFTGGGQAWRTAPTLVADYRFFTRPRLYPTRDVSPATALNALRHHALAPLLENTINALLRVGSSDLRSLAAFQVRALDRIIGLVGADRCYGTVVCAGTGSGKTLAFYLPAYAAIAAKVSGEYWTKCLALYPRNELLKDQLREALSNARRVAPVLTAAGRRRLVIGALYGEVPQTARQLTEGGSQQWRRTTLRQQTAFECPFVRCPECGRSMLWLESDIAQELERLCCVCGGQVEQDEIRLTRKRMLAEPPDVLFTSTEMLNQQISSSRFARLFGIGLRAERRPDFVLIDEVHAYEGVHGAHVALLLRRWRRASLASPQFVGLSATLTDASRFFADLVGIGPGDVAEVSPHSEELRGDGAEHLLALRGDPASGTSLLSTSIQALMLLRRALAAGASPHFGTRVFAFTDNLDVTNRLFHSLLDAEGWDAFGRPNPRRPDGSLANLRASTLPAARERLDAGQNWALVQDIGHVLAPAGRVRVSRTSSQDTGVDSNADIVVATSALEVGLDDPQVGAVLQHKAPQGPAAFLQRKGRAGRVRSMRPWTVVVLSDYGRDRAAYQDYDQLFSPLLPARYLPLRNRAVLKMQAAYTLCDWLARRLPAGQSADPWADFSQPASAVRNEHFAKEAANRQGMYARTLRSLLEDEGVREEFAGFLTKSLGINEDEALALLWEPPRALLTEVVPTLLRRLERGWRVASGGGLEPYTWRAPLPEFVPRTLFSDLALPEVSVRIPAQGRLEARVETMPVAQALREFAPGRVSRRFGVVHANQRHWIEPRDGSAVLIDAFCPSADRQELGRFSYRADDGGVHDIVVFRPFAIDVATTPLNVQQSSNAFLRWHSEIVPTDAGHDVDVPKGSPWQTVFESIAFHAHRFGLPVEVRRFSFSATASIGRGKGPQVSHQLQFLSTSPDGSAEPAALGFVTDIDAVQATLTYPAQLHQTCASNERLKRGLRVSRFFALVAESGELDGIANSFQREWLARAYLSAVTTEALRSGRSLLESAADVRLGRAALTVPAALQLIFRWDEPNGGDDDSDSTPHVGDQPRRLRELLDLLDHSPVLAAVHSAARPLFTEPDEEWEPWLRARFKTTLGAALVEAAHSLCPRMEPGALLAELEVRSDSGVLARSSGRDELWLTESTIGGGGFVEELFDQYVMDPRRFFRLLEAALAPSDLESVSDALGSVAALVGSDNDGTAELRSAFTAVREAGSHTDSTAALVRLRAALARKSLVPTPALLISMNARLLAPGTSPQTDLFIAGLLRDWETAEQRLGIDIDFRIFGIVKSSDPNLELALGVRPPSSNEEELSTWRFGVLTSILWPRGAQVRSASLQIRNPFSETHESDRLLVLAAVVPATAEVSLSNPDWFDHLTRALIGAGSAILVADADKAGQLAQAILRLGSEPIDSEALLVHARVVGVGVDQRVIRVHVELPEAVQ